MAAENVPSTMTACQVVKFKNPYEISKDIAVPALEALQPTDLLIRVAVASLCHTDFMVADGVFGTELPCIASHEGAGTVVAMGTEVKDWQIGDRCMVALKQNLCGSCISCTQDDSNKHHYCENSGKIPGVTGNGAFAEYMIADAKESSKIPDAVTFETAAPLACAGRTVYRAVSQARLKRGQWIGIVGSGGGLGHLGIQFAKAKGLKIVALDASDKGVEMSKDLKADVVLDAREGKDKVVKQAMEATGAGCDATINLSDAESAAGLAAAITKMHSHVVQIAQPDEVKIPFAEFIFRDIKFEGSLVAGRRQSDQMLREVAEYGITVRTHALHGIDKVPELAKLSEDGKIKGKGIIIIDEDAIKKEKELGAKF